MTKHKLSKWLKTNLKNNIKDTLEETMISLLQLNPPIKKTTVNKRKALQLSIKSLLRNNEKLQEEYETLNMWITVAEEVKENKRKLKVTETDRDIRSDEIEEQNLLQEAINSIKEIMIEEVEAKVKVNQDEVDQEGEIYYYSNDESESPPKRIKIEIEINRNDIHGGNLDK